MKTNKSFTKRLKVTKTGKILARKPGQNHFNAKEARHVRLNRKRVVNFSMSNKMKNRFMPNSK